MVGVYGEARFGKVWQEALCKRLFTLRTNVQAVEMVQLLEIDRFTQRVLATCSETRRDFLPIADQLGKAPQQPLDFSSPEAYAVD